MNKNQAKAIATTSTTIEDYVGELQARAARAREYGNFQQIALDFIEKFPNEPGEGEETDYFYPDPVTRCAFTLDTGTVQAFMINFDARNMEEVKPRLRYLREQLGVSYKVEDSVDLKSRAYVFNVGGKAFRFQVFFGSFRYRDSKDAVCNFVQVGVKEEPVYKLMCDQQEVSEEEVA